MNFPFISCIDDVLPYISESKEISVKDHGNWTVIAYNKTITPETFLDPFAEDISKEESHRRLIVRECRGLVFDNDGYIIRRPFHKFKNIGESEETQSHQIDWNLPHMFVEKLDGSLICPFLWHGNIIYGTKSVDLSFHELVKKRIHSADLRAIEWMVKEHPTISFCFEFMSPENRIVVNNGPASEMVLLAARDIESGQYDDDIYLQSLADFYGIEYVRPRKITLQELDKYSADTQDEEGLVVVFENGERYKVKTEWYRKLHRVKSDLEFEHNLATVVLNGTLDDLLPILLPEDVDKVLEYSKNLTNILHTLTTEIKSDFDRIYTLFEFDRKRYAQCIKKDNFPWIPQIIFGLWDGRDCYEQVLRLFIKNAMFKSRWEDFKKELLTYGFRYNIDDHVKNLRGLCSYAELEHS